MFKYRMRRNIQLSAEDLNLSFVRTPSSLEINFQPSPASYIGLMLGFLLIGGSLIVGYITSNIHSGQLKDSPLGAVFMGGACIAFFGLMGVFNRTHLSVMRECIIITQGPLPWSRKAVIPMAGIKEFSSNKNPRTGGKGLKYEKQDYYQLVAYFEDKTNCSVVASYNEQQIKMVQREIEQYLKCTKQKKKL